MQLKPLRAIVSKVGLPNRRQPNRQFLTRMGYANFQAQTVTPIDIEDYKAFLQRDQQAQSATVNRRLAALRKFFEWDRPGHGPELPRSRQTGDDGDLHSTRSTGS